MVGSFFVSGILGILGDPAWQARSYKGSEAAFGRRYYKNNGQLYDEIL